MTFAPALHFQECVCVCVSHPDKKNPIKSFCIESHLFLIHRIGGWERLRDGLQVSGSASSCFLQLVLGSSVIKVYLKYDISIKYAQR